MKRLLFLLICFTLSASVSSCKKCKHCHTQTVLGTSTPAQKYCGDELEAVEKNPVFICE